MKLLVSGASAEVNKHRGNQHLGLLAVPAAGNAPDHYQGWTWAADNGAFSGFNETAFLQMLDALQDVPGCLFVACPDVVGNAGATLRLFSEWTPRLRADGWPVALVAQDGLTVEATPWDALDALFIGGSTEWKLGEAAALLVADAKHRGKWVHMGRVNGGRRVAYAARIGCDSIDGSGWSRFSRIYLRAGLAQLAHLEHRQLTLEGAA
jgi:hypothetical protein